ncbi:MAG: hypothetical protein IPG93_12095 [Burkholderiales bacterium]|nr:hypothetical protein [Burkholderiales bacterium]
MLKKLEWELAQLASGWDEYKTFNFAVTAHHLHKDWIDRTGTREQKNRRKQLPREAKLVLDAWRDITNASKHWCLNADGEYKRVVETVSKPIIGDWYAYFIAGPVIYVTIGDARPSIPELTHVTVKILSWIISPQTVQFSTALLADVAVVLRLVPKQ